MDTMPKTALFFYSVLSTFVKKDIEILSTEFHVKTFDFYTPKKSGTPLLFIKQKLFLLRHIWSADIMICQFAGYASFLPALFGRLFGKPFIIIVGGTDAVSFPSIRYGNFYKGLLGTFTRWSYQLCTHIAPKHKTLMICDYTYEPDDFPKQGIEYFIKGLNKPYTEITNGYDPAKWYCTKEKVKNTFITVSNGWEYPFQYQMKGVDLIVDIAPLFPDCTFTILGVPPHKQLPLKSPNIKVLPPVKNEELKDVFSNSEFYMQLSMAEGFPNALSEAMLCECIPVGSSVFSIPEIIGDSGFVLEHKSLDELKALLTKALTSNKESLRKKARARIADNYTYEMRKEKLLKLCRQLTQ